jgi:hypothetical protein
MQCKDISDARVLELIRLHEERFPDGIGLNRWELQRALDVTEKLLLAKMRILLRRDLVLGCACGCRGDFRPGKPAGAIV